MPPHELPKPEDTFDTNLLSRGYNSTSGEAPSGGAAPEAAALPHASSLAVNIIAAVTLTALFIVLLGFQLTIFARLLRHRRRHSASSLSVSSLSSLVVSGCVASILRVLALLPPMIVTAVAEALRATADHHDCPNGHCSDRTSYDFEYGWPLGGSVACQAYAVTFFALSLSAAIHWVCVSLDRYCAITLTFHYREWVTKSTRVRVIGVIWCLSVAVALVPAVATPGAYAYEPARLQCSLASFWGVGRNASSSSGRAAASRGLLQTYAALTAALTLGLPLICHSFVYATLFRVTKSTTALARRNSLPLPASCYERSEVAPSLLSTTRRASCQSSTPEDDSEESGSGDPSGGSENLVPPSPASASSATSSALQLPPVNSPRRPSWRLPLVHRDDRKAAQAGLLVLVACLISWLPINVLFLYRTVSPVTAETVTKYDWLTVSTTFLDCAFSIAIYAMPPRTVRRCLPALRCSRSMCWPGGALRGSVGGTSSTAQSETWCSERS